MQGEMTATVPAHAGGNGMIIGIIVVIVLAVGGFMYTQQQKQKTATVRIQATQDLAQQATEKQKAIATTATAQAAKAASDAKAKQTTMEERMRAYTLCQAMEKTNAAGEHTNGTCSPPSSGNVHMKCANNRYGSWCKEVCPSSSSNQLFKYTPGYASGAPVGDLAKCECPIQYKFQNTDPTSPDSCKASTACEATWYGDNCNVAQVKGPNGTTGDAACQTVSGATPPSGTAFVNTLNSTTQTCDCVQGQWTGAFCTKRPKDYCQSGGDVQATYNETTQMCACSAGYSTQDGAGCKQIGTTDWTYASNGVATYVGCTKGGDKGATYDKDTFACTCSAGYSGSDCSTKAVGIVENASGKNVQWQSTWNDISSQTVEFEGSGDPHWINKWGCNNVGTGANGICDQSVDLCTVLQTHTGDTSGCSTIQRLCADEIVEVVNDGHSVCALWQGDHGQSWATDSTIYGTPWFHSVTAPMGATLSVWDLDSASAGSTSEAYKGTSGKPCAGTSGQKYGQGGLTQACDDGACTYKPPGSAGSVSNTSQNNTAFLVGLDAGSMVKCGNTYYLGDSTASAALPDTCTGGQTTSASGKATYCKDGEVTSQNAGYTVKYVGSQYNGSS